MQAPTLIAEIGCNHMGDLEIAKRFIEVAGSFCEVRNIKFQKRSNRDLLSPDQFQAPHPVTGELVRGHVRRAPRVPRVLARGAPQAEGPL